MKQIYKNKVILRDLVVMVELLLLWFILTFTQVLLSDSSLTVLDYKHKKNKFEFINTMPILDGEKREFLVNSKLDNLGIVWINFEVFNRFNEDYLTFRIRERSDDKWLYEKNYYTKEFSYLSLYPFGFPAITDSMGKEYVIQIESIHGTPTSSVSISKYGDLLITSYQFDKELILSDRKYFINFFITKFINSFNDKYLLFASLTYLNPFVFYLIWFSLKKRVKIMFFVNKAIVISLLLTVMIDIFAVKDILNLLYSIVFTFWLWYTWKFNKRTTISYSIGLILIIFAPILQSLDQSLMLEKSTIWAFLILTTGVIVDLYAIMKNKK